MKISLYILILFSFLTIVSCDAGLEPLPEGFIKPGFSGTITFIGQWPENVNLTSIVLFKDPLQSAADFNVTNLKFVGESIPKGTLEYNFTTLENILFGEVMAGEYAYLAVAQTAATAPLPIRALWKVAGVYVDENNQSVPGKIVVPEDTFLENVNIICDFDNPPQQPPGL